MRQWLLQKSLDMKQLKNTYDSVGINAQNSTYKVILDKSLISVTIFIISIWYLLKNISASLAIFKSHRMRNTWDVLLPEDGQADRNILNIDNQNFSCD